jgi:hypothetical protein
MQICSSNNSICFMPPQLKTNVLLHTTASPTAAHLNIVRAPPSAPLLEDDDVAIGSDVLDDEPEPVDEDALAPGAKSVTLVEVVPLAVFEGFREPDEEAVVRKVDVVVDSRLDVELGCYCCGLFFGGDGATCVVLISASAVSNAVAAV